MNIMFSSAFQWCTNKTKYLQILAYTVEVWGWIVNFLFWRLRLEMPVGRCALLFSLNIGIGNWDRYRHRLSSLHGTKQTSQSVKMAKKSFANTRIDSKWTKRKLYISFPFDQETRGILHEFEFNQNLLCHG